MPSPRDLASNVHALAPRDEKRAVCDVYALRNYYRIHVDFTNWDHDKGGCADEFETTLKKTCGKDNISDFTCTSEGPKASHVEFYITYDAKHRMSQPMDKAIEDAIYDYSGSQ
ncbi:MAG: hypothetical protein M1830_004439, partial [Pleopsidium flavum]